MSFTASDICKVLYFPYSRLFPIEQSGREHLDNVSRKATSQYDPELTDHPVLLLFFPPLGFSWNEGVEQIWWVGCCPTCILRG